MAGELTIIDRVIAEHQIIRRGLQGVQSSASDYEALFSLQQAQSSLAQSAVGKLGDQKTQMLASLGRMRKGLDDHFSFEESALPPLFGEVFMKALILEHAEIKQQIAKTVFTAERSALEGLNQKDMLDHKSLLQETTNSLSDMIEQHANLEEQMLRLLRKTFVGETGAASA
jgi:hypothetical protein